MEIALAFGQIVFFVMVADKRSTLYILIATDPESNVATLKIRSHGGLGKN